MIFSIRYTVDIVVYSDGTLLQALYILRWYSITGAVGATYMHIARNRFWNGGTTHWGISWKQCIYEDNQATGASVTASGAHLDLSGPPICVLWVKYIDLVSPKTSRLKTACIH